MVATEIVTLPLKAAFKSTDKTSESGVALAEIYKIISAADGFVESWYGSTVEDDKILKMIINWTSVEDHVKFTKSNAYPALEGHLAKIAGGPPSIQHHHFASPNELKLALSSPVTESATSYLPSADPAFEKRAEEFVKNAARDAQGSSGVTWDWSVEEDVEHEKLPGGKGRAFLLLIGWPSVDAHMEFRESDAFKRNVHLLREGPVAMKMEHIKAKPQSGSL